MTKVRDLLMWGIIAIIFIIFLIGGGASLIFNVSNVASKLPTFAWIIIGVIVLLIFWGGD